MRRMFCFPGSGEIRRRGSAIRRWSGTTRSSGARRRRNGNLAPRGVGSATSGPTRRSGRRGAGTLVTGSGTSGSRGGSSSGSCRLLQHRWARLQRLPRRPRQPRHQETGREGGNFFRQQGGASERQIGLKRDVCTSDANARYSSFHNCVVPNPYNADCLETPVARPTTGMQTGGGGECGWQTEGTYDGKGLPHAAFAAYQTRARKTGGTRGETRKIACCVLPGLA